MKLHDIVHLYVKKDQVHQVQVSLYVSGIATYVMVPHFGLLPVPGHYSNQLTACLIHWNPSLPNNPFTWQSTLKPPEVHTHFMSVHTLYCTCGS